MSGIEVAGLVLGGFPILLNCLDYYREGFEPLEEWWNFRTRFIAFVDDIRHQMMRYHQNLILLLDPIVSDSKDLVALIENADDPRWKDGSLEDPLLQRLASELDRFLRIIDRMHETMQSLNKLLQIEDGRIAWIESPQQQPWQWHYKRLQISFSRGKQKKVQKLAIHNQELEEILGYSTQIIPISDRRKASDPVALLEKIRQLACHAHEILRCRWNCKDLAHRHEAHLSLRARVVTTTLAVTFVTDARDDAAPSTKSQEVTIQLETLLPAAIVPEDTSVVQRSIVYKPAQEAIAIQPSSKSKPSLLRRMLKKKEKQSSKGSLDSPTKNVRFQVSPPTNSMTTYSANISVNKEPEIDQSLDDQSNRNSMGSTSTYSSNSPRLARIPDICAFLDDGRSSAGILENEVGNRIQIHKRVGGSERHVSKTIVMVPLHDILDSYSDRTLDITRQDRFEIATNIASALLQTWQSPWLARHWGKKDFYFLVNKKSQSLYSNSPLVSQAFVEAAVRNTDEREDSLHLHRATEYEARTWLFKVGVIILELIFGQNIEDCSFRKDYYGKDDKPNDQTDLCTAKRWAQKVEGDSGPNIGDAVRRCLDCSFGPRPNFADVRFRESVYEGVIKPLSRYSDLWEQ